MQFITKCLLRYIIIQSNDNMDRLFGKELSNLMQQNIQNKAKQVGRIHSQSTRSTSSEDHSKVLIKRFNRSSFGQPLSKKNEKVEVVSILVEEEKQEPKDVQMVEEYFQDCFQFMMSQEKKCYKLKNYMPEQTQINQKMRGILLDWIIDLHHKFKMFPQTLFAAVTMIDMYLSKKGASKQNLQLIGTAALYSAAKYEETYQVPELNDLVYFAAKAFTKQQIIKMEADIIEVLDFNLIMQTSFRFLEPLSKMCKMQDKNFHLAQYALELSLLDTKFLQYKPSLIASSGIYLINKIRKRPESWPKNLQSLTGYEQSQLKTCARQLCYLLQRADDLMNTKSIKKKFSLAQYHEVTRIKLQRKKQ